jgi:hypothetical protein
MENRTAGARANGKAGSRNPNTRDTSTIRWTLNGQPIPQEDDSFAATRTFRAAISRTLKDTIELEATHVEVAEGSAPPTVQGSVSRELGFASERRNRAATFDSA